VKPPGEFKLETSADGVTWEVYKKDPDNASDWRFGLTDEMQKERNSGRFFFNTIWDTDTSGNTITDVFDTLKPILKVRYTLRSPVLWHYGIWYATAYTEVYNA